MRIASGFHRLKREMTAEEALAHVRKVNKSVETVTSLYVLEADGRLAGVPSLRDLVVALPKHRMDRIMNPQLVTVTPVTDQEEVARFVSLYDYLAIPVVSTDGIMLGVIPVDDVIDILVSESIEDILKFCGMEGGVTIDQPYFTVPTPHRDPQTGGLAAAPLFGGDLQGSVLRHFEDELAQVVALSFSFHC